MRPVAADTHSSARHRIIEVSFHELSGSRAQIPATKILRGDRAGPRHPTLKNAIEQGRIAHGYIFSGHRGIGKTTIARILAMALNCQSQDHPVAEPCGVCDSCREIRAGNCG